MCLRTSDCGISLLVACSDNVFVYRCIVQVHRLVGVSFSRDLGNNQLTELPEGLLSTTTQLEQL